MLIDEALTRWNLSFVDIMRICGRFIGSASTKQWLIKSFFFPITKFSGRSLCEQQVSARPEWDWSEASCVESWCGCRSSTSLRVWTVVNAAWSCYWMLCNTRLVLCFFCFFKNDRLKKRITHRCITHLKLPTAAGNMFITLFTFFCVCVSV